MLIVRTTMVSTLAGPAGRDRLGGTGLAGPAWGTCRQPALFFALDVCQSYGG